MSLESLLIESVQQLHDKYTEYHMKNPNFKRWFSGSKVVCDKGLPLIVFHGTHKEPFEEFKFTKDIGFHFGSVDASNHRVDRNKDVDLNSDDYEIDISSMSLPDIEEIIEFDYSNLLSDIESEFNSKELRRIEEDIVSFMEYFDFEDGDEISEDEIKEAIITQMHPEVIRMLGGEVLIKNSRILPCYLSIKNPYYGEDLIEWRLETFKSEDFGQMNFDMKLCKNLSDVKKVFEKYNYDGYIYENQIEGHGEKSFIAFQSNQIKSIFNGGEFNPNNNNIFE